MCIRAQSYYDATRRNIMSGPTKQKINTIDFLQRYINNISHLFTVIDTEVVSVNSYTKLFKYLKDIEEENKNNQTNTEDTTNYFEFKCDCDICNLCTLID